MRLTLCINALVFGTKPDTFRSGESLVGAALPGHYAVRRARPFARRRFNTRRPFFVFILWRKPCFFFLRRLCGWKVRFTKPLDSKMSAEDPGAGSARDQVRWTGMRTSGKPYELEASPSRQVRAAASADEAIKTTPGPRTGMSAFCVPILDLHS